MTKKKQRGVKRSARRLDDALGALGTKSAQRPQNTGKNRNKTKSGRNQNRRPERSGYQKGHNNQNARRDNYQNASIRRSKAPRIINRQPQRLLAQLKSARKFPRHYL